MVSCFKWNPSRFFGYRPFDISLLHSKHEQWTQKPVWRSGSSICFFSRPEASTPKCFGQSLSLNQDLQHNINNETHLAGTLTHPHPTPPRDLRRNINNVRHLAGTLTSPPHPTSRPTAQSKQPFRGRRISHMPKTTHVTVLYFAYDALINASFRKTTCIEHTWI